MHFKFLAHGTGSGKKMANYLGQKKSANGEDRAAVEFLEGDLTMTAGLIDSLKFVNRYSSSAAGFHIDDKPTKKEIKYVVKTFKLIAFAGLDEDQYSFCAVQHTDKNGKIDIHFITARVELTTGKSLNIAPPGWQKHFDVWRDEINYKFGWARPDDPRLSRKVRPAEDGNFNFDQWKAGDDPRQKVTEWLASKIEKGTVNSRTDVVAELKKICQVNREGSDYISIRIKDAEKPIRLKGKIYEHEFSGEEYRKQSKRPPGREQPNEALAAEARDRLEKIISGRAEYNKSRYQRVPGRNDSGIFEQLQDVSTLLEIDAPDSHRDDNSALRVNAGFNSGLESVQTDSNGRHDSPIEKSILQQPSRTRPLQVKNDPDRTIIAIAIRSARTSAHRAVHQFNDLRARLDFASQQLAIAALEFVKTFNQTGVKKVTITDEKSDLPPTEKRVKLSALEHEQTQLTTLIRTKIVAAPNKSSFIENEDVTARNCLQISGLWVADEPDEFVKQFADVVNNIQRLKKDEVELLKSKEPNSMLTRLSKTKIDQEMKASREQLLQLTFASNYYKHAREQEVSKGLGSFEAEQQKFEAATHAAAVAAARLEAIKTEIPATKIEVAVEEQNEKNWRIKNGNFPEAGAPTVHPQPEETAAEMVARPRG